MAMLKPFNALRLKPGYVLRAYVFREGGNGNGIVWAMPVESVFPEPDQCSHIEDRFLEPPKPAGAVNNYMDAVDGDGTPWSYLSASLLARELGEFGAAWHGCDWSTHRILGAAPWQDTGEKGLLESSGPASTWKWSEAIPTEWQPTVTVNATRVTVMFYTYTGYDQQGVVRHTDVYTRGKYRFKAKETRIGVGNAGYVF